MSLTSILTGLVGIAAMMLSIPYFAEAQTIPIPEFNPKLQRYKVMAVVSKNQLKEYEHK